MEKYTYELTYTVTVIASNEDKAREMVESSAIEEVDVKLVDVEPISIEDARYTE